jgi:hypothetical protein
MMKSRGSNRSLTRCRRKDDVHRWRRAAPSLGRMHKRRVGHRKPSRRRCSHANPQARGAVRSGRKQKRPGTGAHKRRQCRLGARIWAIAGATGYSARPSSGRPLFGEAIAREGLCGPWRRSQCRRGGVRRLPPRDRRSERAESGGGQRAAFAYADARPASHIEPVPPSSNEHSERSTRRASRLLLGRARRGRRQPRRDARNGREAGAARRSRPLYLLTSESLALAPGFVEDRQRRCARSAWLGKHVDDGTCAIAGVGMLEGARFGRLLAGGSRQPVAIRTANSAY